MTLKIISSSFWFVSGADFQSKYTDSYIQSIIKPEPTDVFNHTNSCSSQHDDWFVLIHVTNCSKSVDLWSFSGGFWSMFVRTSSWKWPQQKQTWRQSSSESSPLWTTCVRATLLRTWSRTTLDWIKQWTTGQTRPHTHFSSYTDKVHREDQ